MGRVNKTIDGVFTDIVGGEKEISSYTQFLTNNGGVKPSKQLGEFIEKYKGIVDKHKSTFERLASIEEVIIQMRIMENIQDIKLSMVREYIYARIAFYRKNHKSKDIRVIVGKIDLHPEVNGDLSILVGNEDFMNKAKAKLIGVISEEINENIKFCNS